MATARRPLNADMEALRAYVLADTGAQTQAESTVRLVVTHSNLQASFMDIRLDLHMTIDAVKRKLCFHCGTPPSAQVLQLKDDRGRLLAVLDDEARKLGYYSPQDGFTLHIIDTDPTSLSANGWLEDVSKVDKYVMSDEAYAARDNTYRKYKEAQLARDPNWTLAKEMARRSAAAGAPQAGPAAEPRAPADDDTGTEEAAAISVGARCEVEGGKRGVVRYVGRCEGLPLGWWIGVQYDEPVGKNDGSVKGQRYFECPQGYGGFVRPALVKTGEQYRPFDEDLFGSDDEL
ncbi:tubulin folding cofactor B [Chlorella sorokiniana]|uniref:Tubulin folding cofactor B n=1 Tax=Chlorella sorokiniana TaxID=3076 RepID=A0A2P6TS73_CHLSO|nr:tubulin folding cofactor B [Chlorella sorokiniana]|eukprot:PRW56915.1 tubulin folding cofactor B [Chlorella sorokiniana]